MRVRGGKFSNARPSVIGAAVVYEDDLESAAELPKRMGYTLDELFEAALAPINWYNDRDG
jgi:hypothetical protein